MQENTFLTVFFFLLWLLLKQITVFTCSLIKRFVMYANHKSTQLIISSNITSQIEATQRRDIYLLANWSHKLAGRSLHVNRVSNGELLTEIVSLVP